MSNRNYRQILRQVIVVAATSTLMGLGAVGLTIHASHTGPSLATPSSLMLAQTQGSERRGDRRDDRGEDRDNRQDTRDECRDEGGVVGKDKRDCKQEGRQENRGDGDSEGEAAEAEG